MAAAASHGPQLTKDSINPNVLNAQYAVRGELVIQADQFNSQLQKAKAEGKPHGLPFNELVYCNIGNPQQLKQKPLTFFREVLALTTYPDLIETARAAFAPDAIERAKTILASMPGGSGAYSHSAGVEKIRQNVAKFIEERDGFPSDPNDIFLTNGASPAIQNVLSMIIRGKGDGVLIPIPQYPLYTASIALFGGTAVEYELDEDNGWALRAADLEAAIAKAKSNGVNPRALVIINPGNPTGQCLDVANMREVVQVCARHNVVLLADEVYQENVYDKVNKPFHSFKKVLRQCTPDIANKVELFSFHSVSKGFIGECGRRGGYMECANINAEVKAQLYKLASISLCPNLDGQIVVDLMVRPPREGDHSWPKYKAERDAIYESLKRRAQLVAKSLNELEGVKCNSAEGAMYLFPRITLGPKAIAAAKEAAKQPDMFYCLNLLRETGLVVVPGSGFGQKAGTFHFRTTFLPPEDQVAAVSERLAKFHKKWVETYPLN